MAATLSLTLTDAAGQDLNDRVLIDLFSTTSSEHLQASEKVRRDLVVTGITAQLVTLYRVLVTPANHRMLEFFLRFTDGEETHYSVPVPVDPSKVVSISGPDFKQLTPAAQNILNGAQCPSFARVDGSFVTGSELYTQLDNRPLFKACFLNIVAKSAATPLPGGSTCLDRYLGLLSIAQDRLFLQTTAALVEEASHSSLFHPVSELLHTPLPGYHKVASFKTFDHYGNLQLTFQRRGDVGNDYVVDVDIDDAQGIEHLFQVVRNAVAGPTNPYNIHDILLQQNPKVDPEYQFTFAAVAVSHAS